MHQDSNESTVTITLPGDQRLVNGSGAKQSTCVSVLDRKRKADHHTNQQIATVKAYTSHQLFVVTLKLDILIFTG